MTVQAELENSLRQGLAPELLQVENESHMHNVPPGSESHFRVVLVSEQFVPLSRVRRHQRVYELVKPLTDGPIHALALHTYTPAEWAERQRQAPQSPACMGGAAAARGTQSGESQ